MKKVIQITIVGALITALIGCACMTPVQDEPESSAAPQATQAPDEQEEEVYRQSVKWDWKIGDFVRDGAGKMVVTDGHQAYIDWCLKVTSTERMACLAYDSDIGTEFEHIMHYSDYDRAESDIERTITEALMVNPLTEYVRDFEFKRSADQVYVTFTVKGKPWPEDKGLALAMSMD